MSVRVRYIVPHGQRVWLRIYWGDDCGSRGCHSAMLHLFDTDNVDDTSPGGRVEDYPDERWPTACEDCGRPVPSDGDRKRQVFRKTLYATPDRSWIGMPGIGDCYYADWYGCEERGGKCIHGWTNCDGRHLIVHCPDPSPEGNWWDTNGRASNCGSRNDTTHRCWVVHGSPEAGTVHVDKNGKTCSAGAGSIDTGRWHGFLHNGHLL